MRVIERVSAIAAKGMGVAGATAMVLMMLHVTFDVVVRALYSVPLTAPLIEAVFGGLLVGTIEVVSTYYMVAVLFLPLALVTLRREHIFVELFTQKMSPRGQALVSCLSWALGVIYVVGLAWRGWDEALLQTEVREAWETATYDLPVWPSRWFVPLGCGAMAIGMLLLLFDNLSYGLRGRRLLSQSDSAPMH